MPLLPLPLQPVGGCALLITALMANEDGTPFFCTGRHHHMRHLAWWHQAVPHWNLSRNFTLVLHAVLVEQEWFCTVQVTRDYCHLD